MTTTWDDLLYPGRATDFFQRRAFPSFNPSTNAYSSSNALWLAELSRLVYRDTPIPLPSGNNFPDSTTYIRHSFFDSRATDTQAMLIEFDGELPFAVLSFRGTEKKIKDIVTDLKLGKVTLGKNKVAVHEGFWEAFDSVRCRIEEKLKTLKCPVFCAGHSLGAALATLAAKEWNPAALYTYGSPRVGDSVFAASLSHIPIYRIVDDKDIIATIPPEAFNYQHAGKEIILSPLSEPPLLDRLKAIVGLNPPKFLADHAPVNYVDRIEITSV